MFDGNVSAVEVAGVAKPLCKRLDKQRIAGGYSEHSYARRLAARLRIAGERRGEEAARDHAEEFSPIHHSIT
jgi:hypothetical protein